MKYKKEENSDSEEEKIQLSEGEKKDIEEKIINFYKSRISSKAFAKFCFV